MSHCTSVKYESVCVNMCSFCCSKRSSQRNRICEYRESERGGREDAMLWTFVVSANTTFLIQIPQILKHETLLLFCFHLHALIVLSLTQLLPHINFLLSLASSATIWIPKLQNFFLSVKKFPSQSSGQYAACRFLLETLTVTTSDYLCVYISYMIHFTVF